MLAVQKIVHRDETLDRVYRTGEHIRKTLHEELGDHEFFREVRGRGLNTAIEYACENHHLFSVKLARIMRDEHGILINAKWHRTTFTPAFIITDDETDLALEAYIQTFKKVAGDWSAKMAEKEAALNSTSAMAPKK